MGLVTFLGWEDSYALFRIERKVLANGKQMEKILVAHMGRWTEKDGMACHPEYELYEDVQKDLGKGLGFICKEQSKVLYRSLFLYGFENSPDGEYILAVPATGEDFNFEIYGMDHFGSLVLLEQREL